ncbi:MAG: hypothetical protein ACRD27_01650 [Terracidiphilus sp.]
MHFHFDFSAAQILWTLTFAAVLVLLVVLFGRERTRRFPWFTASIALLGLRLLGSQLLSNRLPPIRWNSISLPLADLAALLDLLVLVEVARRAFGTARRRSWWLVTAAVVAVAAAVVILWGPWPAWKTLTAGTTLSTLRLLQMAAQKIDMLAAVIAVELGLLVTGLGWRFGAGWRTHVQRIVVGLSAAAISLLTTLGVRQAIATHTIVHSRAEFERLLDLQGRIVKANSAVYVAVLIWWIACLWIDEAKGQGT